MSAIAEKIDKLEDQIAEAETERDEAEQAAWGARQEWERLKEIADDVAVKQDDLQAKLSDLMERKKES